MTQQILEDSSIQRSVVSLRSSAFPADLLHLHLQTGALCFDTQTNTVHPQNKRCSQQVQIVEASQIVMQLPLPDTKRCKRGWESS